MIKQNLKNTILVVTLVALATTQETGLKIDNLEPSYLELEKNNVPAVFCKITVFKGEHNISNLFITPGSLEDQETPISQKKSMTENSVENSQVNNLSLNKKRILASKIEQEIEVNPNKPAVLIENNEGNLISKATKESSTSNIGPLHTIFLDCIQPKVDKSEKEQFGGLCQPDKQKLRVRLVSRDGVVKMDYETDLDRQEEETVLYFLEKQNYNENNGMVFDEDSCLLLIKFSSILKSIAIVLTLAFV